MIGVIFAVLAISTGLETITAFVLLPRWVGRGIQAPVLSPRLLTLRVSLASSAALAAGIGFNSPLTAVSVYASAWLAGIAVTTDLACMKIPKEPCWIALSIGTLSIAATLNLDAAINFGITFLAVSVALIVSLLISRGGLGSGDFRLVLGLTPLAAWFGVETFLWGLITACLTQLVFRATLARQRNISSKTGLPFAPAIVAGQTLFTLITVAHLLH